MMIVDAQIHIWAKGTPSAHHRQEPYSKDQALAGMDEAGVDRAVIHPVMWDPDSNELAVEAVRAHPDRFAILGWFYLDRPESRALVDTWKNRPGMLGLRFYFNEPRMQSWPTDGTLDWLWPAAERAGLPVALAAAAFLPVVGQIAERHPGLKLIVDHMGVPSRHQGRRVLQEPAAADCPRQTSEHRGQGHGSGGLCLGQLSVPQHSPASAAGLRRVRTATDVLGNRHYPHAVFLEAMRHAVHRGAALADRTRPRSGDGTRFLRLDRLEAAGGLKG